MVRNFFLPEVTRMRNSFFAEQILLDTYFLRLEAREAQNSGITESTYADYFNHCSRIFGYVREELEGFPKKPAYTLENLLTILRQSSARVGALQVQHAVNNLDDCVPGGKLSECQVAFQQLKREFQRLKDNLETYFELKYRFPHVHVSDDGDNGDDGSDAD